MFERVKNNKKDNIVEDKVQRNVISISRNNGFIKIEINEYISIIDYVDIMEVIDPDKKVAISNNILWDSSRQCVEKGTYYITSIGNKVFNIKINDQHTEIDERLFFSDGEVKERILNLKNDGTYYFSLFKHYKSGSTYVTSYYNNVREVCIPKFQLSKNETFYEIWELFSGLKGIQNIDSIMDINILNKDILANLVDEYYYVYRKYGDSNMYDFCKYDSTYNTFYDYQYDCDAPDEFDTLELGQKVYIDSFGRVYPFYLIDNNIVQSIERVSQKYEMLEKKYPDLWPEENIIFDTLKLVNEYIDKQINDGIYTDAYVIGIIDMLYKAMGIKVRQRHGGSLYSQLGFDYPEEVYESIDALYNLIGEKLSNLKENEVIELVLYENGSYGSTYEDFIKELHRRTGYTFSSDLEQRIDSNYYHSNYNRMKKLEDLVPVVYIGKNMCIYNYDASNINSIKEEITPSSSREKYFNNKKSSVIKRVKK